MSYQMLKSEREGKIKELNTIGQLIAKLRNKSITAGPIEAAKIEIEIENLDDEKRTLQAELDKLGERLAHLKSETDIPDIEPDAPPEPELPPDVTGFVGRATELAFFSGVLARAHFAVITGMPGVGKSMLAAKLAQQTVGDPARVFWHRFHEGEGVEAVIWKLAGMLARNGQDGLWVLLNRSPGPGGRTPPVEVLLDYLFQLVRDQGYVICLDDFQHVDADPLVGKLIDRLAELVHGGAATLIITSRRMPDFVKTEKFPPLLGFSRADAAALLFARKVQVADALFGRLYEQTAGNAELLNLAIVALQHTASPERLVAQLVAAEDVENYLLHEVDDKLTEAERAVMSAVAVLLGQGGTRGAIETVLGGDSVQRTLRQLCNRYLLNEEEDAAGKVYSQHTMVRSFYYELLGQRERRQMHARAAAYYETEEPDRLRAARHYRPAGEYERSASLATEDVNGAINHGQMGLLRLLLGQYQQVQLQPQTWAQVLLARGIVAYAYGENSEAQRCYQAAADALASLPAGVETRILQARVHRRMAQALVEQEPNEALTWLRRGLEHLADMQVPEQADLRIACGAALIHLGQFETAEEEIRAGLALLPADATGIRVDALLNLSLIHSNRGDLAQSIACTTEALPLAERLGDSFRLIKIYNSRAVDHIFDGDWVAARNDFQEALRLGEQVGDKSDRVKVELNLGSLHSKMGDEQAAVAHWGRSLELARKNELNEMVCAVQASAAEVYLWQGELAAAAVALDEAESLAERHGFQDLLPEIWRKRGQLYLAQGWPEQARAEVERSLVKAEALSLDAEAGMSLRVLAEALLALDAGVTEASEHLQRSLTLLTEIEPHEAGRTRLTLGQVLLAQGDVEATRRQWTEASEVFGRLGAQRDLDIATALLVTLPAPTNSITMFGGA